MRKSCTGLRNSDTPATLASCGRRRAITACPATSRSAAGLKLMNMKPPPARAPPVKPTTVATAGSRWMIPTSWRSLPCMAWNEMLWSARMPPLICPVSWRGNKPLGTALNRYTFKPITNTRISITSQALDRAQSSACS